MTTKLPRLWDEKITTAKGRKVKRYSLRNQSRRYPGYGKVYVVLDKVTGEPLRFFRKHKSYTVSLKSEFQTRQAAENWLKRTTIKSYQLQLVNAALRMTD